VEHVNFPPAPLHARLPQQTASFFTSPPVNVLVLAQSPPLGTQQISPSHKASRNALPHEKSQQSASSPQGPPMREHSSSAPGRSHSGVGLDVAMGRSDGTSLADSDGISLGFWLGVRLGERDRVTLGGTEATEDGMALGSFVGPVEGEIDGTKDGTTMGSFVGSTEGSIEGRCEMVTVGKSLGISDGSPVGRALGKTEGRTDL